MRISSNTLKYFYAFPAAFWLALIIAYFTPTSTETQNLIPSFFVTSYTSNHLHHFESLTQIVDFDDRTNKISYNRIEGFSYQIV